MKKIDFEYNTSHIPMLKRYNVKLIIMSIIFLIVGLFQGYVLFSVYYNHIHISLLKLIISYITAGVAIFMILSLLSIISGNCAIIKKVKEEGSFFTSMRKSYFNEKSSWSFAYRLFVYILNTILAVFATAVFVQSICKFIYYEEFNYFLPCVLLYMVGTLTTALVISHQTHLETYQKND